MSFKRHFLLRRRIDPLLLATGFAAMAILNPVGKVVFLFFAACGLYLAFGGHRTRRHAPPVFSMMLIAYCVWQIGLSLLRGEPVSGNRLLSYASIELLVVFLPLGICLVRRPFDALSLGSRFGLLLLCVATAVEFLVSGGGRVGLGSNEAILAFVGAAVGLFARLPAERSVRFLPNGRGWFYLSFVPVGLTQTRGAWLVYLLVLGLDLLALFAVRRKAGGRTSRAVLAAAAIAAVAVLVPIGSIVYERLERGIAEVEQFQTTGTVVGSVDVRLAMWMGGTRLLAQHPLIGVGSTRRVEEVGRLSGANYYMVTHYTHLHNLFLDEALSSGLIGLALMLGVFAAFAFGVFKGTRDLLVRQTSLAFLFLVFSFGSFHGVLLNEWMIIITFGFMSIVLTTLRRRELAERIRRPAPSRSERGRNEADGG